MSEQNLSNQVARLRSENLSNEEIVQRLLYQGYSNADVFDAMSQADVTPATEDSNQQKMEYTEEQQYQYPQNMNIQQPAERSMDTNKIAEIAESIIEEKWSDLVDHVNRIIEWKSSMELKLTSMEEQLKSLKADFDTLHTSILGKIGESDSTMREVAVDIKALEQVFKKILPGFVENVNELSRITQTLKRK